jgi:Cu-processing system ATP-binding protein
MGVIGMETRQPAMRAEAGHAVSLRGAVKHYGAVRAVDGVDLDIGHGEVFGLIGHNGAGKSTLFKMMLGLVAPTCGDVRVLGQPVAGSQAREARRSIGYLPENVVLYDNLSGLETLRYIARLKGVSKDACEPALDRVGLGAAAAKRPVREYSKGMRQRLGFAQALLGRPRVLFLDEPTTGLDPDAIHAFYATLAQLRADGVTMVLSSHILAELQQRVDRVAIMAAGKVQAVGSVQGLRERAALPLRMMLRSTETGRIVVRDALATLSLDVADWQGCSVTVSFPRESKMALLSAVSSLGSAVVDLQLHEPSLEDVFFGLAA